MIKSLDLHAKPADGSSGSYAHGILKKFAQQLQGALQMGDQLVAGTSPEYSGQFPHDSTLYQACGRVILGGRASTSSPSPLISLGPLRASVLFR